MTFTPNRMEVRMKFRGYRFAIEWIAFEDEPECMDVDVMSSLVSVLLVADLFSKSGEDVARDVVRSREKRNARRVRG